ncbi:MAG: ribosomal protein L7/L12, partial [Anaerolineae bacterium]|nr:ribosomal protein L7/L12 [Anaerolineae bacterium]
LKEIGPKKIEVIKAVRQLTALGLKESKNLVDSAPSVVLEAVSKDAAEDAKSKMEAGGAVVEIK